MNNTCALVAGSILVPKSVVSPRLRKAYTYMRKNFGEVEVFYSFYEDDKYVYFNRNLAKFRKHCDLPFEYNLVEGKKIEGELRDGYELRPYQKELVNNILTEFKSNINVFFQAKVRWGKTFASSYIISKLKRNTIVIVDRGMLVDQFINDIKEYSTFNVGKLNKNEELYDITVTTFQYLNANQELLTDIKSKFGIVLVDEAHGSAAYTYAYIINQFPSRYRLAMSATPTRSDGKSQVLYDMLGDIKFVGVNPDALTATIKYVKIDKPYYPSPYNPKASLRNYLLSDEVKDVVFNLIERYKDKTIMVVSDIKAVQEYYTEYAINSNMKKKDRTKVLDKINRGEITLFSGYGVMLKGITIPRLEVIIHLFAATTKENVEQLKGRLLTPPPDGVQKSPLFIELQTKNMNWKECQREKWLLT